MGEVLKFVTPDGGVRKKTQKMLGVVQKYLNLRPF